MAKWGLIMVLARKSLGGKFGGLVTVVDPDLDSKVYRSRRQN